MLHASCVRFSEFRAHLPMAEIQDGVKSGKLKQGTFFVSAYNCREGNVLMNTDSVDTKPGFEKGKFVVEIHFLFSARFIKPAINQFRCFGGVQKGGTSIAVT